MRNETRTQSELAPIVRSISETVPIFPSKPESRWFSLSKLFLFVTVFAVLLSIFLPQARKLFQSRSTKIIVEKDWNAEDSAQVRMMLRYRDDLTELAEKTPVARSVMLRNYASLPRLTELDLVGSEVTDSDLRAFAGLPNIEEIALDETAVTDNGLSAVASLPRLKVLSLSGCDIADQGLAYFSGNSSLEEIDLRNTYVTDAGMEHLATIKPLQTVHLSGRVTQDGISVLLKNQSIRFLRWNGKAYESSDLKDLKQELNAR